MSLLTSCRQEVYSMAHTDDLPAKVMHDVSYGTDSAQRMDIYLPAGRSSSATRSLVLIHGGGWNSGSKNDFTAYIDSFRKRMPDYAIFNLNYRLVNDQHLFPAQEHDIRRAMNYISEKASDYAVDKNSFILLGASAGAHLALLQAYKYNDPQVLAVIDFFGPTDLTAMYQRPWHPLVTYALKMITGTTPQKDPELYRASSPIHFIHDGAAPTLIFHGTNDPVVSVQQSRSLKEKLKKAGVVHELVLYPGQRHGWSGSMLTDSFDRIEAFLKKTVERSPGATTKDKAFAG